MFIYKSKSCGFGQNKRLRQVDRQSVDILLHRQLYILQKIVNTAIDTSHNVNKGELSVAERSTFMEYLCNERS